MRFDGTARAARYRLAGRAPPLVSGRARAGSAGARDLYRQAATERHTAGPDSGSGRVGAGASFHGAGLVDDHAGPDSPHQLIAKTQAAFLFAIAQNDDANAPGDKVALRAAADAAHRPAEIEVYPAQHGWCTIDAPIYDEVQAEKAWSRLLALFKANL